MAVKPSPTTLRRQLGAELRRLRADRTVADVAGELGWSDSKLSRIETAHTGIRPKDLDRLLEAYGVAEDGRARIRALAGQSRQRAWWEAYGDVLPNAYETYIGFEAEATGIYNYEAQIVPGLLQTAEYASAVIQADGVYEDEEVHSQRVAVRMARQAVLTRDPPPKLSVILDEAVLRRQIGGPDIMRRQLTGLVEANERSMITVYVLPFSAGAHRALAGSFVILEFSGDSDHPLVYCEGMTGGVFRSRQDELRSYWMSFEALRAAALNPRRSVEFINAVVRDNQ
ncbi:helix-turn-helix domain-containing protein [Phytohabitans rumicis]|uniref:Transcriptional regulator n=1 Tax=Phytohabitans rumicis TaxID=1076125 RepID=A0A6V8LBS7_9ACTN|nr:helix-turn-helix transcriptional regulator [Phytohabitans rumicis]GFJ91507.1 transcriptional regulator [Phytohabitans rumicis]